MQRAHLNARVNSLWGGSSCPESANLVTSRWSLADPFWGIIYWRASLGRSRDRGPGGRIRCARVLNFKLSPEARHVAAAGWFPAFLRRRRCKVQRGPTYDLGSHDAERASSTRSIRVGHTKHRFPATSRYRAIDDRKSRNWISRIWAQPSKSFSSRETWFSLVTKNSRRILD